MQIFDLTSFSDSHDLKLFHNLFHKPPAWYANNLRPTFVVCYSEKRTLLAERKLLLFLFSE